MASRHPASRNASHPVNAILNYAYAVLQSQVQIKAVADGSTRCSESCTYEREGSPAFVFDLMEPERTRVDRVVWISHRVVYLPTPRITLNGASPK
jgi:CRISPR-associated protein Cas1